MVEYSCAVALSRVVGRVQLCWWSQVELSCDGRV